MRHILLLNSGFFLAPWPDCGTRDIEKASRMSKRVAEEMSRRCPNSFVGRIEHGFLTYAPECMRDSQDFSDNIADNDERI